jgi:bifunctional DNA-binding transcriptional regulator/antitoxin component of YhaV-PrlF toxin-antitoxin module
MHCKVILFSENHIIGKYGNKKMLAKLTSKNQITIPKKIMDQLPDVKYFDLELRDGVIRLKPLTVYETDLDQIRSKIRKLGLKEGSVAEAIKWARSK